MLKRNKFRSPRSRHQNETQLNPLCPRKTAPQYNKKAMKSNKKVIKLKKHAPNEIQNNDNLSREEEINICKISSEFALFIAEKNCKMLICKIELKIFYRKWQTRLRRQLLDKLKLSRETKINAQNTRSSSINKNHSSYTESSSSPTIPTNSCKQNKNNQKCNQKRQKKYEKPPEIDETLDFLINSLNSKAQCFIDDVFSSYSSTTQSLGFQQSSTIQNSPKRKWLFENSGSSDDIESLQSTCMKSLNASGCSYSNSNIYQRAAIEEPATTEIYDEEEEMSMFMISTNSKTALADHNSDMNSINSFSKDYYIKEDKVYDLYNDKCNYKTSEEEEDHSYSINSSIDAIRSDYYSEKNEEISYNTITDDISFSGNGEEQTQANKEIYTIEYEIKPTKDVQLPEIKKDSTGSSTNPYSEENAINHETEEEDVFQFSDNFEEVKQEPIKKPQRITLPKPIPQSEKRRFKDPILASKNYIEQFAISSSEFSTEDDFRYIAGNNIKKEKEEEFNVFAFSCEEDEEESIDDSFDVISNEEESF